MKEYSNF